MATTTWNDSEATARLVDRAAGGDASALNALLARHVDAIRQTVGRRVGQRLAGRLDPSDIVQEAQQAAVERFADYCQRRPMPFRLWLLKTAHERIIDAERQHLQAAKRSVNRKMALPEANKGSQAKKGSGLKSI